MHVQIRSILLFALCLSLWGCTTAANRGGDETPIRERIEWCNIWIPNADLDALPRVLIIGDSITVGYFPGVEKQMEDIAYTGRLSTSRFVSDPVFFDELRLVLRQYHFAVIHFNNGLHGFGYTEESYQRGMRKLFETLKREAGDSILICANSTPIRESGNLGQISERNERVIQRNQIVAKLAEEFHVPLDDLYSLTIDHPEFQGNDGVHFNNAGKEVQSKQVADRIRKAMMK